jgi:type IV secretion system protein VirB10
MRQNRIPERIAPEAAQDPREGHGAEIIDLATRNVLPAVTQRKPRSEGLGLAAGIAIVGTHSAAGRHSGAAGRRRSGASG